MRRVFTGALCALAIVLGGAAASPSQAQLFNSEKKQDSKAAPNPVYNSNKNNSQSGATPLFLDGRKSTSSASTAKRTATAPKMGARKNGFDQKAKGSPTAMDSKIRDAAMARLTRTKAKAAAVRAENERRDALPDKYEVADGPNVRSDRRFGALTKADLDAKAKEAREKETQKAARPENTVYDKHKGGAKQQEPAKLFNTNR